MTIKAEPRKQNTDVDIPAWVDNQPDVLTGPPLTQHPNTSMCQNQPAVIKFTRSGRAIKPPDKLNL